MQEQNQTKNQSPKPDKQTWLKVLLVLAIIFLSLSSLIFMVGKSWRTRFFVNLILRILIILVIFLRMKLLKLQFWYLVFSLILGLLLSFIFIWISWMQKDKILDQKYSQDTISQTNTNKSSNTNNEKTIDTTSSTTTKNTQNNSSVDDYLSKDLWDYTWKYYALNIKHTKIDAFDVVLDWIVVVEKPFWKPVEWYTNRDLYTWNDKIVKYVLGYYTLTAKENENLKNLQFSIIYEWGIRNGWMRSDWVNVEANTRFWFQLINVDEPIKIGETKKIITVHWVDVGMLTSSKIGLQFMKYYTDTNRDQRLEADITQYVK